MDRNLEHKTKNEKDKSLSKDSKDEPRDDRSELEIDEEEIPLKKLRTSRKTQPKQKSGQSKTKQNTNSDSNSKIVEESPLSPDDPTGMEAEEETSDDLEQPRQVHQIFVRFSLRFSSFNEFKPHQAIGRSQGRRKV